MSTIGSSTSGASSIRGYGGLASGLDRDTLIENLTYGTRAKIAKQKQQKQIFKWKQEAYRSVSSKMVEFSRKYMSYTNKSSNVFSSAFWSRSSITAMGTNSKYVTASGSSSMSDSVSIAGVRQLAKEASMISKSNVSDQKLETGNIDLKNPEDVSMLEGGYLSFKYGSKTYSISLSSGTTSDGFTYDYSTGEKTEESITRALKNVSIGAGKSLADVIDVKASDPSENFTLDFKSKDTAGNTLMVSGGSEDVLNALGFKDFSSLSDSDKVITDTGMKVDPADQKLFESKTFEERVAGKNMSFTYNGMTKSIKLGDSFSNMDDLVSDIQTKLDKEFGTGRIKVDKDTIDNESGKLTFKTIRPDGSDDSSSVLSISSADKGVIGKSGAFKVSSGESNRLNLNASLADAGLKFGPVGGDAELKLNINGVDIEGLTHNSTLGQIIEKINSSDAGVTVSYMENADKFSIVSTEGGASGKVAITGDDAEKLFGTSNVDYEVSDGQDAIIGVKYKGSDDVVELVRANNSFDLDGLNITVNGTFGYDTASNTWENGEEVTFDAKIDTEGVISTLKDMIDDYNDIIKLVNDEVSTKRNRDYEPLTDEQKEDMSEDEIEKWNEKAKVGMLFNDSDLRTLSSSLRYIVDGGEDKSLLSKFGISTSASYEDNGKLVFDETKFKAAIEANPEDLKDLFIKKEDTVSGEAGGVMEHIKEMMDKYASTSGATKGILIERAGSKYAPTSILSNSLQKSEDSIDNYIDRLKDKLKTETDRYIKQFTNLETVISQMNSQSSYLSSLSGS